MCFYFRIDCQEPLRWSKLSTGGKRYRYYGAAGCCPHYKATGAVLNMEPLGVFSTMGLNGGVEWGGE